MATRTQLLALLFCAVVASVGVHASSLEGQEDSQFFCCKPYTYQACDYARSGNAGTGGLNGGSTVSKCAVRYAGQGVDNPVLKAGLVCNPDTGACENPPAGGIKDPLIRGLDGSFYELFGKNNTVYNLLSERNHHVNVRLYHPPGFPDHLALYIDAVGVLIHNARLAITMVKAQPEYHLSLSVNGGADFTFPGHMVERAVDAFTSYQFRSPQRLVISSRDLVMSIVVDENLYINVLVDEVAASWSDVHGVLGQTHASAFKLRYNYARGTAVGELPEEVIKQKRGKPYKMKGEEDDYITSGLLKTDDKFSRFVASAAPVSRKLFTEAALAHKEASDRVPTHAGAIRHA